MTKSALQLAHSQLPRQHQKLFEQGSKDAEERYKMYSGM